jgi:hypothetical protein
MGSEHCVHTVDGADERANHARLAADSRTTVGI